MYFITHGPVGICKQHHAWTLTGTVSVMGVVKCTAIPLCWVIYGIELLYDFTTSCCAWQTLRICWSRRCPCGWGPGCSRTRRYGSNSCTRSCQHQPSEGLPLTLGRRERKAKSLIFGLFVCFEASASVVFTFTWTVRRDVLIGGRCR